MSTLPTLETLPRDTIVDILHCFNNYGDLQALVAASPVFHRLYKTYLVSIHKQVFLNIHGPEAWKIACTVLTYQRNTFLSRPTPYFARLAIKRELSLPFTLRPTDTRQLIKNQLFFESCSVDYATGDYPLARFGSVSRSTIASSFLPPRRNPFAISEPKTFSTGTTFPAALFYRVWLMSYQYCYSSMAQLALLPPLVDTFADFRLMWHIMAQNGIAYKHGCMPNRQLYGVLEGCRPNAFFTSSVCMRAAMVVPGEPKKAYELNPPLFMKMMALLKKRSNGGMEFWAVWAGFMSNYWLMGLEELCAAYQLDRFKEWW